VTLDRTATGIGTLYFLHSHTSRPTPYTVKRFRVNNSYRQFPKSEKKKICTVIEVMQRSSVSLIASRRNCKSEVTAFTYTLLSEFCGQNQATTDCVLFRLQTYTFWNVLQLCTGITFRTNLTTQSEFCRSELRRSNCVTFKHLRVFSGDVWRVDTISKLFRVGPMQCKTVWKQKFFG